MCITAKWCTIFNSRVPGRCIEFFQKGSMKDAEHLSVHAHHRTLCTVCMLIWSTVKNCPVCTTRTCAIYWQLDRGRSQVSALLKWKYVPQMVLKLLQSRTARLHCWEEDHVFFKRFHLFYHKNSTHKNPEWSHGLNLYFFDNNHWWAHIFLKNVFGLSGILTFILQSQIVNRL